MFTILGAGGAIGNELVKELAPRNEAIRLVSRNPTLIRVQQKQSPRISQTGTIL